MVLQRLRTAVHCLGLTVGPGSYPWQPHSPGAGRPCGLASWGWGWTDLGKLVNFHLLGPSQSPPLSSGQADGLFAEMGPKPFTLQGTSGKKIKINAPSPRRLSLGFGLHSPILPHLLFLGLEQQK